MMCVEDVLSRLKVMGVAPIGWVDDSRFVHTGDIFLACPGERSDGRQHIGEAIARGAAAVLWEADGFVWNDAWSVVHIAVPGLRDLLGPLVHQALGEPSRRLSVIAVTGTNGKTSCTQWIASAYPGVCAVMGTLGAGFPARGLLATGLTTPTATQLNTGLAAFVAEGAVACALEASSIGICSGRLQGLHIDVAVFTNLTHDHLDYHGSMEAYANSKAQLFRWPGLRVAVLNLDDSFGVELLAQTTAAYKIGYSLRGVPADTVSVDLMLTAQDVSCGPRGLQFCVCSSTGEVVFVETQLMGRYNVANVLAVSGVLLAAGVAFSSLPQRLASLIPPLGRMQRMSAEGEPLVIVDYAHSPDALANTLLTLRELADRRGGKLVCVFGCGGERDDAKRPLMGRIAAAQAEEVFLTNDNPRGEDPEAIVAAIRAEVPWARVLFDRCQAIAAAILGAKAEDVVLVAGKGHETYQEIAGVRYSYSDGDAVNAALVSWRRERDDV